jgi:hypothetical protein
MKVYWGNGDIAPHNDDDDYDNSNKNDNILKICCLH